MAGDLLAGIEPDPLALGRAMLQRARWAARAFARYDGASVQRIVRAATGAAAERASEFARRAVAETGSGVVEHKVRQNLACSTGLLERYEGHDYTAVRVDEAGKVVEVPRPAGVVLALTPSTDPVATLYVSVLLSLLTRNAVVVCPHPLAREVSAEAARTLAEAAVAAGAPDGCVQCVEQPSDELVDTLLADGHPDVVIAPVGPGNVPVLVDRTADVAAAAATIVASACFDNSVLPTSESVVIVEDAVADALVAELARAGAHLLAPADRDRIRDLLFPGGHADPAVVGQDATALARRGGVRVPAGTRVLLAPIDLVLPEEPLAREKLCPVLGLARVPDVRAGIEAACVMLRLGGAGHAAAVHSTDPDTLLTVGTRLPVRWIGVNVGAGPGGAGVATSLAPSLTVATGSAGRARSGEGLEPAHLVKRTRLAWSADPSVLMPSLPTSQAWPVPGGPVPAYPVASNAVGAPPASSRAADVRYDRGAVTEREVLQAKAVGARMVIGPAAVLTPLARDRARADHVEIVEERRSRS